MLRGWDDHVASKLMNPTTREVSREGVLRYSEEEKDYKEWEKEVIEGVKEGKEEKDALGAIYRKVLIDEVNEELVNKLQKKAGKVGVLLVNEERAESLERMWRAAHTDYYQTVGVKGGAI